MPRIDDLEPALGFSVRPIYENLRKWTNIQNELMQKYENGEVKDGPSLLFAFRVLNVLQSYNYPPKEIDKDVEQYLQDTYGNHVYTDRRLFDGNQIEGLNIVKALSNEYDKSMQNQGQTK